MPHKSLNTSSPVTQNTKAAVIGGKRFSGAFMPYTIPQCDSMPNVKNGKCDFHTRIQSRIAGCADE